MIDIPKSILSKINTWMNEKQFSLETRQELEKLIKKGETKELIDRFYCDLTFGTGGIRGKIGAGTNRINIHNIQKASYACARYRQKQLAQEKGLSVAIAYDSRQFSYEFAQASSEVYAANGFHVYFSKTLTPVPILSYMVRYFHCHLGVCITASHNPPEYNGYKAYWSTGGQLVPPHDQGVIQEYQEIEDTYKVTTIPFEEAINQKCITLVGEKLNQSYLQACQALTLRASSNRKCRIVYSPIHGSGLKPVLAALTQLNFKDLHVVPEQREPDGKFPTVPTPDPGDPQALKMSLALAKQVQADLILATDPDCDRLSMAVKEKNGYWVLNGNEVVSLLTHYTLSKLQKKGKLIKGSYSIKSIVTTDLVKDLSIGYDLFCHETLTGFKWIADYIESHNSTTSPQGFVCAAEESYGFLRGLHVRDKDAIIAAATAAEMMDEYIYEGISLREVLNNLYKRYHFYSEHLESITFKGRDGSEKIDKIMHLLRKSPPLKIAEKKLSHYIDYRQQKTFVLQEGHFLAKGNLTLPPTNMLQFFLEDQSKISVRPSGTEPKVKFYFSVRGKVTPSWKLVEVKEFCQQRIEKLTKFFLNLSGKT